MTKKITNAEIKSLLLCIDELGKRNANLPVKVWYALSKNASKLTSADKVSESARIKLVEKYGDKAEGSDVVTVSEAKMPDFQKEYIDLMNIEVDVEFHSIDVKYLEQEIKSMNGVPGILLFFNYIVDGELEEANS